jgi:hypothetical protein
MASNAEEDALAAEALDALEVAETTGAAGTRRARAYALIGDRHPHEIVVAMYRKIKALRQQVTSLGGTPV